MQNLAMTGWDSRDKRVVQARVGSLPDNCDPRIAEFHRYWLSLKPAPDLLPGRQHFDPVDVPGFLPWLWLVDVEQDPIRFRYRLVGTGHVEALGAEDTGKYMDEALAGFAGSESEAQHFEVVRRGAISYLEQPSWVGKLQGVRWFRRLLLPFARDGRTVDLIMGLGYYSDREKLSA